MQRLMYALIALAVGSLVVPAAAVPIPPPIDAVTDTCDEPVPGAVHLPGVTREHNNDDRVFLDVFIVRDRGVTRAQAQATLAAARAAYEPLHVRLRSVGSKAVTLRGTDPYSIIAQTKNLFRRGRRPPGADVVWTLTTVDLVAPNGISALGVADCIGGVRYPTRAFLVAQYQAWGGAPLGPGPLWFNQNLNGKLLAHETGHLLGAQHHYANCAEGIPTETSASRVEGSPCTVMANVIDVSSINFGQIEAAVVRGHAEEWARP